MTKVNWVPLTRRFDSKCIETLATVTDCIDYHGFTRTKYKKSIVQSSSNNIITINNF